MDENNIKDLLKQFKNGQYTIEEAVKKIKSLPFKDIDFAKIDTHRKIRQGFSEAVYCPGKTTDQIINIIKELKDTTSVVLATRAQPEVAKEVTKAIKEAIYEEDSKIIRTGDFPKEITKEYALVITAGTADIPVAKESITTLKSNGINVKHLFDCGIAGVHRLFSNIELIQDAKAIIVVAGMEGALASLVGGVSPCPVIAIPTSIGYGANFQGLAALLSMLNSCTSCVSVVNIDNGYSAGIIASLIVKQSSLNKT